MHVRELNGKNICILGFGREGQATLRALEREAPQCEVTIADRNASIPHPTSKHRMQAGEGWLENLGKFDVIIKSPGIPPNPTLNAQRSKITSATQIFFDTIAGTGSTVIGVTGSKGKSTTASLIHAVLRAAGRRSFLIGNIGNPALDVVQEASKDTVFVMELSSYQLMDLTCSPHIAVITSFFPEHLDYHGGLESYMNAKKNITRHQKTQDVVLYNSLFPAAKEIADESAGRKKPFSPEDAPVRIEETKLQGRHNLGNIAAAFSVATLLGIDAETCANTFRTFEGLPHRLQSLGVHGGIEWVDDSISTTPESAIAALDALGIWVETIILGGQDRGYDFTPLAKCLKESNVRTVILLPDSGTTIRKAIEREGMATNCFDAATMQEAVLMAKNQTNESSEALGLAGPSAGGHHEGKRELVREKPSGLSLTPIVLLSPASPSYGHFKNFEERGNAFKQEIGKNS